MATDTPDAGSATTLKQLAEEFVTLYRDARDYGSATSEESHAKLKLLFGPSAIFNLAAAFLSQGRELDEHRSALDYLGYTLESVAEIREASNR